MANTVIGVYDNFGQAQSALRQLLATGFSSSAVRLRPAEDTQQARAAVLKAAGVTDTETGSHATGGGTLRNFFHDLFSGGESTQGQSHTHADRYAEAVRRGSFVLTAEANSAEQAEAAAATMEQFQPIDVDERASEWQASGWSAHDENAAPLSEAELAQQRNAASQRQSAATGLASPGMAEKTVADGQSQAIPVVQEELAVGKREVQRGGVRVIQRVIETPVQETLNLREERVVVERHAVDQPATAADIASMKEGAIELREMAEEAVVSKTARVVEEVIVGKQVAEKEAVVSDTVRRTDVSVEQIGAGPATTGTVGASGVAGTTGAGMTGGDDFHNHWQSAYGTSGQRYEDYAPAYQYGSSLGTDERYRGKDWSSSEPAIRQQWESAHPQSAWEKVKDAVQYGWNKVAH